MNQYKLAKDKAFLIAVKAIITNSKGEILLLKVNSKLNDAEKWDLPGGLMQFEDTIESALKREVFEETGIQIEKPELVECAETIFEKFIFSKNDIKDVKVGVVAYKYSLKENNPKIKLSSEHDGYSWFSMNKELKEINLSRPSKAVICKILENGNYSVL